MARTDWHDDRNAPEVNSLVPAAAAFVDHEGAVLMIQRSDSGRWSMPGGTMNYGESLTTTVVRETLEETGIHVLCSGLVGVFSNPDHRIEYSDGEVRQEFAIIYRAEYVSGELRNSPESPQVAWVPRDQLLDLPLDPSQRTRLGWALSTNRVRLDPV